MVDRKLHLLASAVLGTSNPARGGSSYGGVARNVAENLARLGARCALVSCVGDDDAGRAVLAHTRSAGVDVQGVRVVAGATTAQYVAVLDPGGELVLGVADMAVLDLVTVRDLDAGLLPERSGEDSAGVSRGLPAHDPPWIFADTNLAEPVLAHAVRRGAGGGLRLAVDAVSTRKVTRLPADLTGVEVLFCNEAEAHAWLAANGRPASPGGGTATEQADQMAGALHAAGARLAVLSRGPDGALVADALGVRAVPALPTQVVDVTGAGDALVAGTLAGLVGGLAVDDAVRAGMRAAAATVQSDHSVRPDLAQALARPVQRQEDG